jgi:hypothetical protein
MMSPIKTPNLVSSKLAAVQNFWLRLSQLDDERYSALFY